MYVICEKLYFDIPVILFRNVNINQIALNQIKIRDKPSHQLKQDMNIFKLLPRAKIS